jgi:ribosomal protein S17E
MGTKEYTWLGVNDMQALLIKVEQGFETNKELLMFIMSERSNRLRARI